jgi:1-acyl-sn-glycerol-3-phosphate acyltransferase
LTVRTPILDVFRPAMRGLSRLYFGLELRGTEHIPASGALLITPNHQTYADPPLVSLPIRRPVYYMAWNRLFKVPGLGWLIRRLRAFPVDIESRDSRATREAVRLLQAGEVVMIFPEGERSLDGSVSRFKLGAFRLAVSLGVPVLPVTIAGGHQCWPPSRVLPRPGRVAITYHPPLRPEAGYEPREAARRLAERAQAAIVGRIGKSIRTFRGQHTRFENYQEPGS